MKFYSNVAIYRNDVLVRGYEDGKRVMRRVPYKPYLFVPSRNDSKYRTLTGKVVDRVDFPTVKEARDFLNQYKEVEGMPIYGLNKFQ